MIAAVVLSLALAVALQVVRSADPLTRFVSYGLLTIMALVVTVWWITLPVAVYPAARSLNQVMTDGHADEIEFLLFTSVFGVAGGCLLAGHVLRVLLLAPLARHWRDRRPSLTPQGPHRSSPEQS